MNYIQISLEANDEQQELLIALLEDLGATGFEQTDSHLVAYFEEEGFNSYDVNNVVKKYKHTTHSIPQQNWNSVWEDNFEPVIIGSFCGVRANFHPPITNVLHEIIITPKMSFGTGHHATTYMMIEQMEHLNFTSKSVFDFGTGTGILAILAKKLGAESVVAVDVDEWSIENAPENFTNNQVHDINLQHSSQIPRVQFDIILANINRNVLLQYASSLAKALVNKGQLLVSGILKTDELELIDGFSMQGFGATRVVERNNWISILFVKSG